MSNSEVLVLLSGGIDSALVVDLVLEGNWHAEALFVDYGQLPAAGERQASHSIASHYGISWSSVSVVGIPTVVGEIPGRNDMLLAIATAYSPRRSVAIGTHSGTRYRDCSPEYGAAWQALLDEQYAGVIQLLNPLASLTKAEIVSLSLGRKIPVDLTYSCEAASVACGICLSCKDRRRFLGAA